MAVGAGAAATAARAWPRTLRGPRWLSGAAAATAAEGAAGAGVPSSVTVISALAGARDDFPRRSSTLVPIITRNTAAIAV